MPFRADVEQMFINQLKWLNGFKIVALPLNFLKSLKSVTG